MTKLRSAKSALLIPLAAGVIGLAALAYWFWGGSSLPLALRGPGADQAPGVASGGGNPVLAGKLIRAQGQPRPDGAASSESQLTNLSGAWPQFRGTNRDGTSRETVPLLRAWPAAGPRELWGIELGEGFAGAAVLQGRVYVMDYDREHRQDALRCLSLADGHELWRYAYPVSIKRFHGITRTVPAVNDKFVVAIGPKCHVVCVDATTGELRWGMDLARQFGTTVPQWYAGQCVLLEGDTVLLAPAGPKALLMAVKGETGEVLWQTPNPHGWKMTHSSITPVEFAGQREYVYCASDGVVGVSAKDGALLWETTEWKIKFATVPSPLALDGGRIFLSGGYDAGSLMLQLKQQGDRIVPETLFRLAPKIFGADQHTPILYDNHIYGVRADGRFACLTPDGKPVWASDSSQQFGRGSFFLAQPEGVFFALNDSGLLRLIEATPAKCHLLAQARVLKGDDSWGPMALAGGRLLARDSTHMVCLDVAKP